MAGSTECPFFLWGLLALLGLALIISLIFNISHYVEKQRQEPIDEDCYEQMKARPERSINNVKEATPTGQVSAEVQMCYASLDHSFKGKHRKPRKQNTHLSDKEREKHLYAMDDSMAKSNLVESSLPEIQAIEENIHDDPIRLFGLIRAKREPME
ncbi:T-cell receptor-associated transmembrane adapter 1 [Fukomys damarensis]|nr:T-cell receptor-associated transmembrane adapter 1 [Fukomys damarensis]